MQPEFFLNSRSYYLSLSLSYHIETLPSLNWRGRRGKGQKRMLGPLLFSPTLPRCIRSQGLRFTLFISFNLQVPEELQTEDKWGPQDTYSFVFTHPCQAGRAQAGSLPGAGSRGFCSTLQLRASTALPEEFSSHHRYLTTAWNFCSKDSDLPFPPLQALLSLAR
ncbi:hypothetical protein LEMLEM_LOCUS19288 [Lemmus lemmus]